METMRNEGYRRKIFREREALLKTLGYKGMPFEAKYPGKCGLTGQSFPRRAEVAYFREHGLCLTPAINEVLYWECRTPCAKHNPSGEKNACWNGKNGSLGCPFCIQEKDDEALR